jgi:hypothetical protein
MKSKILVFDVGQNLIGIRSVNGRYRSYYGDRRILALQRLKKASEIVSYNGNRYDLPELNEVSKKLLGCEFQHSGIHTDIQEVYWPNILGSSLENTYAKEIGKEVPFPDSHEGSNQRDVYLTLALWKKHKGV